MGCSNSKLDDLPAVALCRDRCNFLQEAIRLLNALSGSHISYFNSLSTLGIALRRFFDEINGDRSLKYPTAATPNQSVSNSDAKPVSVSDLQSHLQSEDDETQTRTSVLKKNQDETLTQYHELLNYGGGGFDGFFGPPQYDSPSPPQPSNGCRSAGKMTPSPPRGSAWDFFNFFDSIERYEATYYSQLGESVDEGFDKKSQEEDEIKNDAVQCETEIDSAEKDSAADYKANINESESEIVGLSIDDYEIVKEIQDLFEKASKSGTEVLNILQPPKIRFSLNDLDSQGLNGKIEGFADVGFRTGTLSSTLKKLYVWEKKLYEEVKAEEKARLIFEKKLRWLKYMDEKDAESHDVERTRALLSSLFTTINIAIKVVNKISVTINHLRDDELWPHINEFIHSLMKMWKAMLEFHQNQCQAISKARNLNAMVSISNPTDAYFDAAIQLQLEVQNWNLNFSNWIHTQKFYVKALNGWLLRCLLTPDGIVPCSPSRVDAPPLFVICNQWLQAMERISENEVVKAMMVLSTCIRHYLEQHNEILQQSLTLNVDLGRKMKNLESMEQKMMKAIIPRDKKATFVAGGVCDELMHGEVVKPSETKIGSPFSSLQSIFETLEKFTTNSIRDYDELCLHIEEAKLPK
ncbi:protein of unknown function DUF632 [Dillenia turbinata]|uniref:DUF632 domain-containing protein n=1 Tax=Dillenia turbinata TaxID=194707 RepID=A0AAN8ZM49_9MAGN